MKISYNMSEKEALKANKEYWNYRVKNNRVPIIEAILMGLIVPSLLLPWIIVGICVGYESKVIYVLCTLCLVGILVAPCITKVIKIRYYSKPYFNYEAINNRIIEVTEKSIIRFTNEAVLEYSLKLINHVVEKNQYIHIEIDIYDHTGFIIPITAFKDEEEKLEFLNLIRKVIK